MSRWTTTVSSIRYYYEVQYYSMATVQCAGRQTDESKNEHMSTMYSMHIYIVISTLYSREQKGNVAPIREQTFLGYHEGFT
jgi:hypothetical protein